MPVLINTASKPPQMAASAPAPILVSEILSALSFALDLTEGQPMGHSVRSCVLGMRIAHEIGVPELTHGPILDIGVRRLPREVATEQEACPDPPRLEVVHEILSRERRVLADTQREPEPRRVAARGRDRQHEY